MNIFAVIVTYNPDVSQLLKVVSSLKNQVNGIVLVKNSNEALSCEDCLCIQLKTNTGIAYAQNVGITKAIENGADWILLSDQDTVFCDDYIEAFSKKVSKYGLNKIFVPSFYNEVKKQKEPVSISMSNSIVPKDNTPISLIHAISSGSLFHISVYRRIGGMSEKLFIDYIDFEWCWRARQYGIETLCFPDIVINHCLGDYYKKIAGRKITIRSEFRYYYILRNGFYLARTCRYLTKKEKRILLKRTALFAFGIILIDKQKSNTICLVRKALFDSGKMGVS